MAKFVMPDPNKAAQIIRDAGGKVIGRTRLQKIAYLLEVTGLGVGFTFEYRHYGPYSEQLTDAVSTGVILGVLHEEERGTTWGGSYSIFTAFTNTPPDSSTPRVKLINMASAADPIALELAATAVFLATRGEKDPWLETERRKPEKAGKLGDARYLYAELRHIQTPAPLPGI